MIEHVKTWEPIPTAIRHPCREDASQGAIDAARTDLIDPIPVGPLASCAVAVAHARRQRREPSIETGDR